MYPTNAPLLLEEAAADAAPDADPLVAEALPEVIEADLDAEPEPLELPLVEDEPRLEPLPVTLEKPVGTWPFRAARLVIPLPIEE